MEMAKEIALNLRGKQTENFFGLWHMWLIFFKVKFKFFKTFLSIVMNFSFLIYQLLKWY